MSGKARDRGRESGRLWVKASPATIPPIDILVDE
jgi:hypothetical protein